MSSNEGESAASGLDALDLGSFVGRDVAELRAAVVGLGGVVRTLQPGDVVTAEYRADRVNVILRDNGCVVEDVRRG